MADRSGYIGRAPGDSSVTVARQTFSPTGVTTDFTFVSGYTVGYLDLFLNGTKLIEGVDYNATDTSTISLVSAAINGDVLEGVAYKAFNLGDKRIGIQSGGALIGNVDTLNFIGTGNTFALSGGTIDVSISGGGGAGAGGTWSNYDSNAGVTTTKKVKIQNDLEVTGVSTFAAVNATTGSFSGNVGVAGVLTYEDVTNIDSVGLVTARTGIKVLAGGINAVGVVTATAGVSDSIGTLRRLGVNGQSGAYAFVVGDAGKIIRSSGSGSALTLNQNIFTAGDMISVFNMSTGDNTVVQGTGVTLYNTADAATGTRTIAAKGMCTIVCTASNEFAISGSQLT